MKRARKSGLLSNKKKEAKVITEENSLMEQKRAKLREKDLKSKKRKKYTAIFVISLVVIILASLIILGIGGLFAPPMVIEEIEPVDEVSGKVNVLILGVDEDGLRTDTIVVASYDANKKEVNMLSIPRDTRMYVGSKYQKINAAHAISGSDGKIKGPNGTIDVVTRLTGIPINYYVEFSFKAFRETIDALGGIQFNVPQRMKYSDPVQDLYIDLYPGDQLLDGDKAEQLVRFRRYPEGDIKRVEVQQQFIKAVAEQKLNLGIIAKLPELYKTLTENVKTNFGVGDVVKYANSLLDIELDNIVMYQLPGQYSGSEYTASYWLADMKEIKLLVQNTFGYDTKDITTGKPIKGAVYGKITTEILNPEDVVIREEDKHKAPVNDTSSSNTSSNSTSKKNNNDDDDDDSVTTSKNNNSSQNNDRDETDDEPLEEAEIKDNNDNKSEDSEYKRPTANESKPAEEEPKAPEAPVIKPLDDINSPSEFVRPDAN